jgi:hypothetical protein
LTLQEMLDNRLFSQVAGLPRKCRDAGEHVYEDLLIQWKQARLPPIANLVRLEGTKSDAVAVVVDHECLILTDSGCYDLHEAFGLVYMPSQQDIEDQTLLFRDGWSVEIRQHRQKLIEVGQDDETRTVDEDC